MSSIVHIGFGKTGTTALQNDLFPFLAEHGLVDAYNPDPLMQWVSVLSKRELTDAEMQSVHQAMGALTGRTLVSSEALCEWDPSFWTRGADRNLEVFGKDSRIIVTLREPKSYLTSLYQQAVHEGNVRSPSDFLLDEDSYWKAIRYLRPGKLDAFPVDALSYREFISLYTSRFREVVVVPMEAIWTAQFLEKAFSISPKDAERIASDLPEPAVRNRSYSARAMAMTLARERALNRLGVKTLSMNDRSLNVVLGRSSTPEYSYFKNLGKAEKLASALPRILRKIFTWREFMLLTDKIGYQKYSLEKRTYMGKHFEDNLAFYEGLKHSFLADISN